MRKAVLLLLLANLIAIFSLFVFNSYIEFGNVDSSSYSLNPNNINNPLSVQEPNKILSDRSEYNSKFSKSTDYSNINKTYETFDPNNPQLDSNPSLTKNRKASKIENSISSRQKNQISHNISSSITHTSEIAMPPPVICNGIKKPEMTFWGQSAEKDVSFRTPFAGVSSETKYVTFEPDEGGWNNIRMSMETIAVFAHATGRTLVIPPEQHLYLLKEKKKDGKKKHSFADFYNFDQLSKKIKIIPMKEFLEKEAIQKTLGNKPPPKSSDISGKELRTYLREVGLVPEWEMPLKYGFVFYDPSKINEKGVNTSYLTVAQRQRLAIFMDDRKIASYSKELQETKLIHFASIASEGKRMLTHFYSFIHFPDKSIDNYFKRFVRDWLHYTNDIFCYSVKIVERLQQISKNGKYAAFHIRRGDFQYKEVKISAEEIVANTKDLLTPGQVIYISTDEKNREFFKPLEDLYKVYLLSDFDEYANLNDIENPNWFGMIEQVVCSHADTFIGTWFSTFSGYITRMRGYLGFPDNTNWYSTIKKKYEYQTWLEPKSPFYPREFPTSWHKIDDL